MSENRLPTAAIAEQYAKGISAAYSKMVARVGKDEADKWRAGAIASAPIQAERYVAIRDHRPVS